MTRIIFSFSIIYFLLGVWCTASRADIGMKLTGTLIAPPPCNVTSSDTGEETIDINFSDRVGVNKIDGVNYTQPVNYKITCDASSFTWDMTIAVQGVPTTFDAAAVQTNIPELGIRLMQNGLPFELNKPMAINASNQPELTAVPVKAAGADLPEGEFTATATLLVQYQ